MECSKLYQFSGLTKDMVREAVHAEFSSETTLLHFYPTLPPRDAEQCKWFALPVSSDA